jgi:ribosomal protein S12 methylthiotransferase
VRRHAPEAGVRSNFIVGFPGETEEDFATLCDFLTEARLDAIGVFGYSDEDGTEAASYDGKLADEEIAERVERLTDLAEQLTAERAEERIGERVEVLLEVLDDGVAEGRAACQGPEVDGSTTLTTLPVGARVGDMIEAVVVASEGVDLVASPRHTDGEDRSHALTGRT